MRLKQIKLAGFKSFVDQTTVVLPGNLTGVVGPNGCGKSNIIDAVRWVMGESSAKHLRGESMADVVFNGSTTRQPAGHASVELHFDNSEGKWGGLLAQYPEIVIRRQVNLEGQSTYYLNGTVCRRRDISDIFLGTGLGSRNSYAIIAQGDISRLIEAKPEDLRIYLEEAAGISRYKERRRETELRLQHTRENLSRLSDLRDELQRQLDHLSKQAATAEKYQQYEKEALLLRKQLLGGRAVKLQRDIDQQQQQIVELEQQLAQDNAQWQRVSTERETAQQTHYAVTDQVNHAQEAFYQGNVQLAKIEQALQHHQERQQQLTRDKEDALRTAAHAQQQLTQEISRADILTQQITQLTPALQTADAAVTQQREALQHAESALQAGQKQWEQFQQQAAHHARQAEVEQTKIQHVDKHLLQIQTRLTRIQQEAEQYQQIELPVDLRELEQQITQTTQSIETQQQALQQLQHELQETRTDHHGQQQALDKVRTELQALRGRLASLQALQEAALGKQNEKMKTWLQQQQLQLKPRLLEKLNVETGWEVAVETVLSEQLEAVCVEDLTGLLANIASNPQNGLMLVNTTLSETATFSSANAAVSLLTKMQAPAVMHAQLQHIYVCDDIIQAQQLLNELPAQASVVTREGLWLGKGWLRVRGKETQKSGVVARERELHELQQKIVTQIQHVEEVQQQLAKIQTRLQELEILRQEQQQTLSKTSAHRADLQAQFKVQQAQWTQARERRTRLDQEAQELQQQQTQESALLQTAKSQWQHWLTLSEQDAQQRTQLQTQRDQAQQQVREGREQMQQLQQQAHQCHTQIQVLQTQQQACQQQQIHLQQQYQTLEEKQIQLHAQLVALIQPQQDLQAQLQQYLQQQQQAETHLNDVRRQLSEVDAQLRELSQQQQYWETQRSERRAMLEQYRLTLQSLTVRLQGVIEQIEQLGETLDTISQQLPPDISEILLESELNKLQNRMERLGPINLAAISEHATQLERKTYLDQQNDDLVTALETLEDAIRKIDRETRLRFKEVYDKVNELFQQLFPRIFGGGSATLELTGDDLLQTGVNVMARPPGKRNSTIHLLSGGEKALTAIALVFSLFHLNPAPFCLLDEVDAPLDDANVGRFCDLVKEMSKTVQFIFISHNKLAIEMGEHLLGVTMHEPGVSRLVAVDVSAAMEMAEA